MDASASKKSDPDPQVLDTTNGDGDGAKVDPPVDPFAPQTFQGNGGNLDPRATATCVGLVMAQDPTTYGDGTGFTCPALTVTMDGGFGTRQYVLRNAVASVLTASGFDLGCAIDGTPYEVCGWRSVKGAKKGDVLQYGVTIRPYFPDAMSEEDRATVRAANIAAKVTAASDTAPPDTTDTGDPDAGTDATPDA